MRAPFARALPAHRRPGRPSRAARATHASHPYRSPSSEQRWFGRRDDTFNSRSGCKVLLQKDYSFRKPFSACSGLRWLKSFWCLGAGAEEKFLHFGFEKFARLGLDRREAVLVDEHCLMLQPTRPGLLGHALINALAELPGVGLPVEAGGLLLEKYTLNH